MVGNAFKGPFNPNANHIKHYGYLWFNPFYRCKRIAVDADDFYKRLFQSRRMLELSLNILVGVKFHSEAKTQPIFNFTKSPSGRNKLYPQGDEKSYMSNRKILINSK